MPASLALPSLVTADVRFRDPFNDVQGVDAYGRVLTKMFADLDAPRFDLVERFATLFPSRVIHRLVGVPETLDAPLRGAALAIGNSFPSQPHRGRSAGSARRPRAPVVQATR